VKTQAVVASGVILALVAGVAGGALALAFDGGGGDRATVTTIVRAGEVSAPSAGRNDFDPVSLYAGARDGVVTIESSFGPSVLKAGSGFVVDAKRGLIVTASHVVARATTGSASAAEATAVYIVLDDGTRADARLVGYDLFEDTALIQVDPARLDLHALPLGSARALRVGDPIAVIGSPFENRASLSTGVVSQLNRQIAAPGVVCFPTTGVIQTDAAVNKGNSGGPVLNARGRVVGMVTAIDPNARGGLAYAVPIDRVAESYRALLAGHHVRYAWLGVSAATLTPPLADALGLHVERGALVQGVIPGSAAERGGVQVGTSAVEIAGQTYPRDADVIVAVGATPVTGFRDLDRAIAAHRAGQTVELHIVRRGGSHVIPVRLLSRPASYAGCG
jgi:S1-C subfamily serine protease